MQEIGQMSLDIIQTKNEIIIIAPIAGVNAKDVGITVNEETLTIKGTRPNPTLADEKDYLTKECFWGDFERSIILPENADSKNIQASSKNNILEIRIPKTSESKTKVVKINVDK